MRIRGVGVIGLVVISVMPALGAEDPLSSWNEGAARQAILRFVQAVTDTASPAHVPPDERIVVFDNDGTLLSERPVYAQFMFDMDRVQTLAPRHPEWRERQPFKAAIDGDVDAMAKSGVPGMLEMIAEAHAGMTNLEFDRTLREWLGRARHPRFNRPYQTLVYQPMLELLAYLRANGFQTWIVSGSSVEFLRPWTQEAYGIPPQQVIGSRTGMRFEMRGSEPELVWGAKSEFANDKEHKPVAVEKTVGRRPIAAFGNSDGDLPLLLWTAAGGGTRLAMYVHHDDAEREYAYDRDSPIGRLDKGLQEAKRRGWPVVSMKKDWRRVFPFEQQPGRN